MPALWCKLHAAGVAGPLFDWLRMLYQRMRYVVRHEGEVTGAFKSLIGLLTGDPVSPILWDIFFADLDDVLVVCAEDVVLAGRSVSHGEQADDVFLATTETSVAQRKVNAVVGWSGKNFATVSVTKTEYMVFGPLLSKSLSLFVRAHRLPMVKSARYVGVFFSSVDRDIFAEHYRQKAKKARSKTRFTGDVMPAIDPHLTGGCEVVLDRVQREFWRRALGLSGRCSTGVMPLQYRRLLIALRYLQYLSQLGKDRTVRLAQIDTFDLDRASYSSWAGDLRYVLAHLPPEWHCSLQDRVRVTCEEYLRSECAKSRKHWILQRRMAMVDAKGKPSPVMEFREYLRVPKSEHRVALTRLICSDHDLARRKRIPREWRLCRFCGAAVETEAHALLACKKSVALVDVRLRFWDDVRSSYGEVWGMLASGGYHGEDEDTLMVLVCSVGLHQRFARFVFDVFEVYAAAPMFVPAQELFDTFPDLPGDGGDDGDE
ncbi:hypothetical protein BDZ89DRAFT_1092516 [Hymenopellis radicata]|nr:hypothetical protein BDZ89DRAFT_1092516 [Hymenopellis radicata]